jgi:hypothetical protein
VVGGDSNDYDGGSVPFGDSGQAAASVIKARSNWSKSTKQRSTVRREGQVAPTNDYDGNTIDYDSSSVQFGGTGQSPGGVIKQKTDWKKRG